MQNFPSLKSKQFLKILMREPLNYSIVRIVGSHKTLSSVTFPTISYSFHQNKEISGHVVKRILMKNIGLTQQQALEVIK